LQLAYFDCCVNQGGPSAIKLLQKSFNIPADGEWGPVTQNHVLNFKDMAQSNKIEIIKEFLSRRAYRYGTNQLFVDFGLGWSRRLMEVARLTFSIRGS
jgi:lysozyme family protein